MLLARNSQTLEVSGITISFGNKQILNDISFALNINRVTAILGENGSGKSTLLNHMMLSSNYQKNGHIEEKIDFSFVPQKNYLDPYDTVLGQLKFQSQLDGIDLKNQNVLTSKIYKALAIDKILTRRINTLSEGQKRAVALGLAFIKKTQFILLDEPTNSLDIKIRNNFWHSLLDYKNDKNLTIFLSTHSMWEIENFVDNVLILKNGKMISNLTKHNFLNQVKGNIVTIDIPKLDHLQSKIIADVSEKLNKLEILYAGESNIKYLNQNSYDLDFIFETLRLIVKKHSTVNAKISINSPSVEDAYYYVLARTAGESNDKI